MKPFRLEQFVLCGVLALVAVKSFYFAGLRWTAPAPLQPQCADDSTTGLSLPPGDHSTSAWPSDSHRLSGAPASTFDNCRSVNGSSHGSDAPLPWHYPFLRWIPPVDIAIACRRGRIALLSDIVTGRASFGPRNKPRSAALHAAPPAQTAARSGSRVWPWVAARRLISKQRSGIAGHKDGHAEQPDSLLRHIRTWFSSTFSSGGGGGGGHGGQGAGGGDGQVPGPGVCFKQRLNAYLQARRPVAKLGYSISATVMATLALGCALLWSLAGPDDFAGRLAYLTGLLFGFQALSHAVHAVGMQVLLVGARPYTTLPLTTIIRWAFQSPCLKAIVDLAQNPGWESIQQRQHPRENSADDAIAGLEPGGKVRTRERSASGSSGGAGSNDGRGTAGIVARPSSAVEQRARSGSGASASSGSGRSLAASAAGPSSGVEDTQPQQSVHQFGIEAVRPPAIDTGTSTNSAARAMVPARDVRPALAALRTAIVEVDGGGAAIPSATPSDRSPAAAVTTRSEGWNIPTALIRPSDFAWAIASALVTVGFASLRDDYLVLPVIALPVAYVYMMQGHKFLDVFKVSRQQRRETSPAASFLADDDAASRGVGGNFRRAARSLTSSATAVLSQLGLSLPQVPITEISRGTACAISAERAAPSSTSLMGSEDADRAGLSRIRSIDIASNAYRELSTAATATPVPESIAAGTESPLRSSQGQERHQQLLLTSGGASTTGRSLRDSSSTGVGMQTFLSRLQAAGSQLFWRAVLGDTTVLRGTNAQKAVVQGCYALVRSLVALQLVLLLGYDILPPSWAWAAPYLEICQNSTEALLFVTTPTICLLVRALKIEEVKELSSRLSVAQARAEAERGLNESRQRFLRYVFHEVRVPFNAVKLALDALATEPGISEEGQETVSMARSSAESMTAIINNVLQLSAIEAQAFKIDPQPGDFWHMLRSVEFQLRPWAAAIGAELKLEIDPLLPRYLLFDKPRLSQVLSNLASNALKWVKQGRGGKVVLRARMSTERDRRRESRSSIILSTRHSDSCPSSSGGGTAPGSSTGIGAVRGSSGGLGSHDDGGRFAFGAAAIDGGGTAVAPSTGASAAGAGVHADASQLPPAAPDNVQAAGVAMLTEGSTDINSVAGDPASSGGSGDAQVGGIECILPPHIHVKSASPTAITASLATPAVAAAAAPLAAAVLPDGAVVMVRVEVIDNGVGIAPEEQTYLFRPFYQIRSGTGTTGKRTQGTGLGLAIAKEIMTRHGGVVGVRSQLGKGSTFWIELPLQTCSPNPSIMAPSPAHFAARAMTPAAAASTSVSASTVARLSHQIEEQEGDKELLTVRPPEGMLHLPSSLPSLSAAGAGGPSGRAGGTVVLTPSPLGGLQQHPQLRSRRNIVELSGNLAPVMEERAAVKPSAAAGARGGGTGRPAVMPGQPSGEAVMQTAAAPAAAAAAVGRPLRFLIVDDAPSNRKILARLLKRQYPGCVCDEAEHGLEALEHVRQHVKKAQSASVAASAADVAATAAEGGGRAPSTAAEEEPDASYYDVVLMDALMPVMDGYDATREIRRLLAGFAPGPGPADDADADAAASAQASANQHPRTGLRPVIIGITGNALEEDQKVFIEAGVDEVLIKPVSMLQLDKSILELLALRPPHKGLQLQGKLDAMVAAEAAAGYPQT